MRLASIDIGTNTIRLLIADVDDSGNISTISHKRAITRLGGNYTEESGIDMDAAQRTVEALCEFKDELSANNVEVVHAFATSVVRRGKNRDWFVSEVLRRTGIKIRVIEGAEEARLSLLGVLSTVDCRTDKCLVIDIGGGSTEFIATQDHGLKGAWSMEMGVVHLSERHIKGDPPSKAELLSLKDEISGVLKELFEKMRTEGVAPEEYCEGTATLVGTAGTITTLAAIEQGLVSYDKTKINNYTLSRRAVASIFERLFGMTLKQRRAELSLEKGREDLIIPGSAITLSVMEAFGFDNIRVSDAGLLEGILIDGCNKRAC